MLRLEHSYVSDLGGEFETVLLNAKYDDRCMVCHDDHVYIFTLCCSTTICKECISKYDETSKIWN